MSITWVRHEMQQETISPHDCTLLVGIPLEEPSFHLKYNGPRDGNFARSVVSGRPEQAWKAYSTLTNSFATSIDEVERLGVRVYRSLTKRGLAEAMSCEVVTIATQWRSAKFMPADVMDFSALRCELGLAPDLAEEGVLERLNLLLHAEMQASGKGLGASTRREMELIRSRAELEERLQNRFRGGAGIEFSDGFHEIGEVADLFPASFDRVVDLTVCNSVALAEAIRRRCSRALVIAMGDVTRPLMRFPIYVAVMRLLQRQPDAYDIALHRILSQV